MLKQLRKRPRKHRAKIYVVRQRYPVFDMAVRVQRYSVSRWSLFGVAAILIAGVTWSLIQQGLTAINIVFAIIIVFGGLIAWLSVERTMNILLANYSESNIVEKCGTDLVTRRYSKAELVRMRQQAEATQRSLQTNILFPGIIFGVLAVIVGDDRQLLYNPWIVLVFGIVAFGYLIQFSFANAFGTIIIAIDGLIEREV